MPSQIASISAKSPPITHSYTNDRTRKSGVSVNSAVSDSPQWNEIIVITFKVDLNLLVAL